MPVVHSAPDGNWMLPPLSVCVVLQPGVYIAVLPDTSVFLRLSPPEKIAPATLLVPIE
jgi:hypothetical protein